MRWVNQIYSDYPDWEKKISWWGQVLLAKYSTRWPFASLTIIPHTLPLSSKSQQLSIALYTSLLINYSI